MFGRTGGCLLVLSNVQEQGSLKQGRAIVVCHRLGHVFAHAIHVIRVNAHVSYVVMCISLPQETHFHYLSGEGVEEG